MKTDYKRGQEDRYLVYEEPSNKSIMAANPSMMRGVFAVFDGHGGARAAEYCKDNLLKYLNDFAAPMTPRNPRQQTTPKTQHDLICKAFKDLDSAFCEYAKQNNIQDGTTCVLAVIKSNEITVASLGDSICIRVPKNGGSTRLSVSH